MRDEVQKWRELRSVRLSLLWYSVARRKQQENSQHARASPLAFSPIASQHRSFSYSPKMARNTKCAFFIAMHSVACGKQQDKHSPASWVYQS